MAGIEERSREDFALGRERRGRMVTEISVLLGAKYRLPR